MNRAWAILISASFILVAGCGTRNYEFRLEQTLKNMRYEKRLDDNLMPPPAKSKLEELQIYLRPPINMTGPTQTFQMTVVEPGKYDVESSFIEQEKQESLHVLARVKRPKTPSKKAPTPAETTPRGDFNTDVVELVKNVYGIELDINNKAQFKDESKKNNTFKKATVDLTAKGLQIFLYGTKNSPHEVALIFEYPKAEANALASKIELFLESFAVGEKASRLYKGGEGEEEAAEGGEGGGPAVVF